jgi:carboxypeptidase PM20D1
MKKRTKRSTTFRLSLVATAIFAAIIVAKDFSSVSRQIEVPPAPPIEIDQTAAVERFCRAIRIKTVSHANPARVDADSFREFGEFLRQTFTQLYEPPLEHWTGEELGDPENHSHLYRWRGSDADLEPLLIMAHYDVVPIGADSRTLWTREPFAAVVDNGYVWGRGTLDAKDSVMSMIEALLHLRRRGFKPRRTIYLSLGHDEEVGGMRGNRRIAEWMKSRGVRLQFVLDEGGCILTDPPATDREAALIGIAEKGYANLRVTASIDQGGHASMPPPETAIDLLAQALLRVKQTPLPPRMNPATESMLDYLGPELPWPSRIAVANRWLLEPLVLRQFSAQPSGNAMLRTTVTTTMIDGGVQENVLPRRATATFHVRLLPGDSIDRVIEYIRATIDDDRITIELESPHREASPISSISGEPFDELHRCIKEVYPDVLVAPFVLVGATDSSHFQDIARDIYRFIPARLSNRDLKRIHGIDERIAKSDYLDLIRFYVRLLERTAE